MHSSPSPIGIIYNHYHPPFSPIAYLSISLSYKIRAWIPKSRKAPTLYLIQLYDYTYQFQLHYFPYGFYLCIQTALVGFKLCMVAKLMLGFVFQTLILLLDRILIWSSSPKGNFHLSSLLMYCSYLLPKRMLDVNMILFQGSGGCFCDKCIWNCICWWGWNLGLHRWFQAQNRAPSGSGNFFFFY